MSEEKKGLEDTVKKMRAVLEAAKNLKKPKEGKGIVRETEKTG